MSSGPTTSTVNEVVDLVWGTAISLPLAPSAEGPGPWAESAMEAQVQITGAWQGAVVVHASPTLVGWIAQRMFSSATRLQASTTCGTRSANWPT